MKRILLLSFNLLSIFLVLAQTIVSTTVENKNVVLEEFTGIHCGYCPDGHARAKAIQDANPDDVVLINIHTGNYANPGSGEPDFRTTFGDAIAGQTGLTGYPSGTVNRHVFSGYEMTTGGTAQSRGNWVTTSNLVLNESSYINVAIEAEIDVQTRIMTIHVEAYYTGNSPQSTNKLNVVLLQNNTLGPQAGGNMGNEYVHRLVHMITGQWGEDLTTTTQGTFIDKTYSYTIPSDYIGIPVELIDLEVAAFVAEGNQEIISGARVEPGFINFVGSNNIAVESIIIPEKLCENQLSPKIKIKNKGQNTLSTTEIIFSVNDGTDSVFQWSGSLNSMQYATIELDTYEFTMQETNNVTVGINSVNGETDDDNSDNDQIGNFNKSEQVTSNVTLTLTTDDYGSETSWKLYNSLGESILIGGAYANNWTYTKQFNLTTDCYLFVIVDSYGDGGASYSLKDVSGNIIHQSDGSYGTGEEIPFHAEIVAGIEDVKSNLPVNIYPNPVCDMLNVDFELEKPTNVEIKLYNMAGSLIKIQSYGKVASGKKNFEFSTVDLKQGMYYMVLDAGNKLAKKKITIIK